MVFDEMLLRDSFVIESSNPLCSRIPMTFGGCWCWRVQIVREKGRHEEEEEEEEKGGLNGKVKSLAE